MTNGEVITLMSVLIILPSALVLTMEDTDGELGTVVETVVHASGALSRLSECLDLLLNLLEIFVNKLLFLSSSFILFSAGGGFDLDESLSFDAVAILELCGG